MVKKRKNLKQETGAKLRKLEDPDPNSEGYIYDEIESFHRSKDKILLNPNHEVEESDLQEDETEEVLALIDSEDEDEDTEHESEDEDNDDDELEASFDEDDPEGALPSEKAWGKNKKAFYDADVDDDDIEASDEEADVAAEEEEKEAMSLQKRMAGKLDADDFYIVDNEVEDVSLKDHKETAVVKDLSKLSKREKLEILVKDSPDLLPLLDEYKQCLSALKQRYHPLLRLVKKGLVKSKKDVIYIQTKHQLLLNYLTNISFYLALKASRDNVKGHPIIDVIFQHRQLLSRIESLHHNLAPGVEDLLQHQCEDTDQDIMTAIKRKNDVLQTIDDITQNMSNTRRKQRKLGQGEVKSNVDPLDYYKSIKRKHDDEKAVKRNLQASDDEIEVDEEGYDEEGKRKITYQMSKNKGLIRKRRKELKNPRVKHKMKFKKAKIKHKGQVREVKREIQRYGGETTGIKATLSRSVKIK